MGQIQKRSRFCGLSENSNTEGEIQFSNIFLEDNNVEGAQMSGGSFTAGASGLYKVLVNMDVSTGPDEEHWVWVVVNGVQMEESMMHTTYSTYNTGMGSDIASRELLVLLGVGDSVGLWHQEDGNSGHLSASLCVSSLYFQ